MPRKQNKAREAQTPFFPDFQLDEILPKEAAVPKELSLPTSDEFARGLAAMESIAASAKLENRNEATTRLHLIDSLFFECLLWEKEDCTAEEPHGEEYTDYVFSAPLKSLIVEAKREGKYFEIPIPKRSGQSIRSLASLLKSNKELREAAEQVAGYCQARGIPNAVVTNGHQLIAFVGSRDDGIPPLEGRALVLASLQEHAKQFAALWNMLSPQGIREQRLRQMLVKAEPSPPPKKVSSFVSDYPGNCQRNELQADLEIVAELVFYDIAGSRELEERFLNECYCKSGALSKHSSLTKSILEARYARLFTDDHVNPVSKPATRRDGTISEDLVAEGLAKRPIVLVGDVGAGKTTFLRKIIKIDAADILKESIVIYVDLGREATLTSTVRDHLLEEIPRQLEIEAGINVSDRNTVRGIYNLDLEKFGRGIHADLKEIDNAEFKRKEIAFLEEKISNKSEHLKRAFSHISRGQKRSITVILDNCDQRDEPTQQESFLIAEEMASSWDCIVFVSLRPATFNRSRKRGALTGYHPKAFTISPPRMDEMLDKRLAFAGKICTGEIPLESVSVRSQFSRLDAFINVVRQSLSRKKDLCNFLDDLSNGNMRLALDLVKDFITSGHIDSKKILEIYEREGEYTIPLHEFLRTVIYKDNRHFDPESSAVRNVYQSWSHDSKEYFLIPLILHVLDESGNSLGDGFYEANAVTEQIQAFGFTPDQVRKGISFVLGNGLAEVAGRLIPELSQEDIPALRLTSVGKQHMNKLVAMFAYLDAVIVDVRIKDEGTARRFASKRTLQERLMAVEQFLAILDDVWEDGLNDRTGLSLNKLSSTVREEIENIRARSAKGRF